MREGKGVREIDRLIVATPEATALVCSGEEKAEHESEAADLLVKLHSNCQQ